MSSYLFLGEDAVMKSSVGLSIAILACLAIFTAFTGHTSRVFAAGEGEACGGPAGVKCDSGLWCEHTANLCGAADAGGKCIKVPGAGECPTLADEKSVPQSCGCKGNTYLSDCERRQALEQKRKDGPC